MSSSSLDLENIARPNFVDEQGPQSNRKYKAYTSTYALRVAMGFVDPDQIQELKSNRREVNSEQDIGVISDKFVGEIVDAINFEGTYVDINYDRSEVNGASFPWAKIQSLLGQSSTVYDTPIQRLVIRFEDDDFKSMWEDKLQNAVDDQHFPTGWVESPFFAVLSSAAPDSDGKDKVKNDHEERYFLPKSNRSSNGKQGLGWTPRILDLESVWSHKGWAENHDQRLEAWSNRQSGGNWTPHRIEQRFMNFFEPEVQYTGMLRDSELMNQWRNAVSSGNKHDYTSFKTFRWEGNEVWELE